MSDSALGGLSEPARTLLANVPTERDGKSVWLTDIARDVEITLLLVGLLGCDATGLEVPFRCVLHNDCLARLTKGGNGEIVYHDPRLEAFKRGFQTIPELAAALLTGTPRRLSRFEHATWRVRLLYQAGLLQLPLVAVPPVTSTSPVDVQKARDGFELLIRCRWFLKPGEPVPFTRGFVHSWCGIPSNVTRIVIEELIHQQVIFKFGDIPSRHKNPTNLFLPGPQPVHEPERWT